MPKLIRLYDSFIQWWFVYSIVEFWKQIAIEIDGKKKAHFCFVSFRCIIISFLKWLSGHRRTPHAKSISTRHGLRVLAHAPSTTCANSLFQKTFCNEKKKIKKTASIQRSLNVYTPQLTSSFFLFCFRCFSFLFSHSFEMCAAAAASAAVICLTSVFPLDAIDFNKLHARTLELARVFASGQSQRRSY